MGKQCIFLSYFCFSCWKWRAFKCIFFIQLIQVLMWPFGICFNFFSEMHYILWSIHSDFCWNILEFNLILKFSWHRLSRLSWSVIEVQNCRPESSLQADLYFHWVLSPFQVLPRHLVYTGIRLTFCHLKHFFFEIYCILWSFYSIFYWMCHCWQLNLA